jgi:hypothetical protein
MDRSWQADWCQMTRRIDDIETYPRVIGEMEFPFEKYGGKANLAYAAILRKYPGSEGYYTVYAYVRSDDGRLWYMPLRQYLRHFKRGGQYRLTGYGTHPHPSRAPIRRKNAEAPDGNTANLVRFTMLRVERLAKS